MLYVIKGNDVGAIERKIRDLSASEDPLSLTRTPDIGEALLRFREYGLMGPKTVILEPTVKFKLSTVNENLGNLISAPKDNVLILLLDALDKRKKETKEVLKHFELFTLEKASIFRKSDYEATIRDLATERNLRLKAGVYDLLVERIGTGTLELSNALDMLALLVDNGVIEPNHVKAIAIPSLKTLLDIPIAIAARNSTEAYRLLNISEAHPLQILTVIYKRFYLYLLTCLFTDDKKIAEMGKVSNVKSLYYVRKECEGLRALRIGYCINVLLETEVNIKSGGNPHRALYKCLSRMLLNLGAHSIGKAS